MDNDLNINNNNKTTKNPVAISAVCACVGFVLGALGIFGIMKLAGQKSTECDEKCECPKCLINKDASKDFITSFLKLEGSGKNIVYSPLSIEYALSLLKDGADGDTKSEIGQLLSDIELPKYVNVPDKLSLANAVFIRDDFADYVLDSYIDSVKQDYDAEIIYDSFSNTNRLNEWIDDKTFGLIKRVGANLSKDTEMILANALAIQLDWEHQFDTDDTYGRDFYKADGSVVTATTMSESTKSEDIKYYIDDDLTMLSLPLESVDETTLDFVAVMPNDDLENYTKSFNLDDMVAKIEEMNPANTPRDGVDIYVPKFKYEYELRLVNDLKSLGINLAFSDNADFSKIAKKPLKVSDAIHKANIDFSEEGIKAAAVTVILVNDITSIIEPINEEKVTIRIDRPFLFLIRDRNNGTVWFIGNVYEPNLWEDDRDEYGHQ